MGQLPHAGGTVRPVTSVTDHRRHGPHFLRGVELYRNRPVFCSLGNIVSQIEPTDRVSAEDYAKVTTDWAATPGRYYDRLGGHGTRLWREGPYVAGELTREPC